ncbi:hypothetical protein [Cellulomonas sp.]|uniref:hypothetical protein n=1 Tax=Cellulomonas sp. TaxID=40001 RepID=UPI002D40973A|nr:hypothetical protein [Cellulomonas sp.]HYQ77341.1 hypothetical protein [Cellulomonas sp.]
MSGSLAGRAPGPARGLLGGRAHAPARPAGGAVPAAGVRAPAAAGVGGAAPAAQGRLAAEASAAVEGVGAGTADEGALQALTRQWSSLAALGLGLVACGVGAGHLEHHLPVGVALAALGLVAIGWGVLALRGPAPAPRVAAGVALASGPAVLLSAPLTGTATTAAEAAALVLGLAAGVLLALGLRAAGAPGPRRRAPGGAGQAGTLAAGALLVALVTVPGLAATEAGAHAVPHGSHGLPAETGHAGH